MHKKNQFSLKEKKTDNNKKSTPGWNLKISTKIYLAFSGIILLFVVVLFMNIFMINTVANTKLLLSQAYECLNSINEIEKGFTGQKNLQSFVIETGKRHDSSALFELSGSYITNANNNLKKVSCVLSDKESKILNDLFNNSKAYSDIFYNKSLKIGKVREENGGILDDDTSALRIQTLRELDTIQKKMAESIDSLSSTIRNKISVYNKNLDKQFNDLIIYFIIAIILAIAITIVFSLLLSGSIVKNIKRINACAQALGEGNLNTNINVTSNDEIGYLGKVFGQTILKLRSILEKISISSHTVFSAADQILSYNSESCKNTEEVSSLLGTIAKRTENQQDSIKEIYLNSNNISTNINEISNSVDMLLNYANETNSIGMSSISGLKDTISQMSHINDEIHSTSEMIKSLLERSKSIESIADIIKGIAGQTNLLSLNASIEAARANEHGRGFAVVADEIRKLAIQVGNSSKDILSIINDLNDEVKIIFNKMNQNTSASEKGISLVEKTGESFNIILDSVNQQLEKINTLSKSITNLSVSFSNINSSMHEIVESSESVAVSTKNTSDTMNKQLSMSHELSSAATALSHVASELQDLIGVFKF